jgi:hypothetical protein
MRKTLARVKTNEKSPHKKQKNERISPLVQHMELNLFSRTTNFLIVVKFVLELEYFWIFAMMKKSNEELDGKGVDSDGVLGLESRAGVIYE